MRQIESEKKKKTGKKKLPSCPSRSRGVAGTNYRRRAKEKVPLHATG